MSKESTIKVGDRIRWSDSSYMVLEIFLSEYSPRKTLYRLAPLSEIIYAPAERCRKLTQKELLNLEDN